LAIFNTHGEVFDAGEALAEIIETRAWDQPEFLAKKAVT
jgi:kynureninase